MSLSAAAAAWVQGKTINDKPILFNDDYPTKAWGLVDSSLNSLIENRPDITLSELRQLDNTLALTGGTGEKFHQWATDMLSQYGSTNNTLTYFIDQGSSTPLLGSLDTDTEYLQKANKLFHQYPTLAPGAYEEYIVSVMQIYQDLSGGRLNFRRVFEDDLATISFYRTINDIPDGRGGITLGMSQDETNGKYKWRNVYYNEGQSGYTQETKEAVAKNTIVHEMGHTVGLRHPTDLATDTYLPKSEGSGWNTLYSYHDSIMSYNRYDNFIDYLTEADKSSFLYYWSGFDGVDLTGGSPISLQKNLVPGSSSSSASAGHWATSSAMSFANLLDGGVSYGGSGRDIFNDDSSTDDHYVGGNGSDLIIYRGGFDFANGGAGKDVFFLDPITQGGQLTINDFTAGEDMIRLGEDVEVSLFAIGGKTLLVASDTDVVASLQGEFTAEQLFTPTLPFYGLQGSSGI